MKTRAGISEAAIQMMTSAWATSPVRMAASSAGPPRLAPPADVRERKLHRQITLRYGGEGIRAGHNLGRDRAGRRRIPADGHHEALILTADAGDRDRIPARRLSSHEDRNHHLLV